RVMPTVAHPRRVRRWISTALPTRAGVTRPEKRTLPLPRCRRRARTVVASATFSVIVGLVTGGFDWSTTRSWNVIDAGTRKLYAPGGVVSTVLPIRWKGPVNGNGRPTSVTSLPPTSGPESVPAINTIPPNTTGFGEADSARVVGIWGVLNVRSAPLVVPAVLNATSW